MKKRTIIIISILMSISIIGICGLEWYWVSKAVKEKAVEFDRSALKAMHACVNDLESAEVTTLIVDAIGPMSDFSFANSVTYHTDENVGTENGESRVTTVSTFESGSSETTDEKKTVWFKGDENVAVDFRFSNQSRVLANYDINNPSKSNSDVDTISHIIGLKRKMAVIEMAMQRVLVEEIESKPNLQTRIGDTDLDSLLQSNFVKEGIDMPFTYFVKGAGNELELNGDIAGITNNQSGAMNFSVPLFPDFPDDFTLNVGFPSKKVFVLKSLGGLLLLVLLFSLLMVATYAKTLHAMLKQKRLSEVKSDFINNMTHEFKTPLATIGLALESIKHPSVSTNLNEVNRFTGIIAAENKRLSGHVEKILQLAKMEKGQLVLNKEWFEMSSVIESVAASMSLRIKSSNGSLTTEIPQESTILFADENHIRNVLLNLVDNALKYTVSIPAVTITCKIQSYFMEVIVTDNGIGMNPEVQRKAFDTFYRAQTGNIHNVKGFGLGLSYMRDIVRLHHGELLLASSPEKGTTIGFKIPLVDV